MLHCDFCNDPIKRGKGKRIHAKSFVMFMAQLPEGKLQQSNSKGDWCACVVCAEYIRREAWEELIDLARISHR